MGQCSSSPEEAQPRQVATCPWKVSAAAAATTPWGCLLFPQVPQPAEAWPLRWAVTWMKPRGWAVKRKRIYRCKPHLNRAWNKSLTVITPHSTNGPALSSRAEKQQTLSGGSCSLFRASATWASIVQQGGKEWQVLAIRDKSFAFYSSARMASWKLSSSWAPGSESGWHVGTLYSHIGFPRC